MALPLPTDPASESLPTAYVIQRATQICDCCGATHHFSTLYAKSFIKSRMGAGGFVRNLRALTWPRPDGLWNLPIEHVDLPVAHIPFCHACSLTSNSLYDWPTPPTANAILGGLRIVESPAAPAKPKTSAGKPTLRDALDLI